MSVSGHGDAEVLKRLAQVIYVHSEALQSAADQLPANVGRSSLVHSLVRAYELVDSGSGSCVPSQTENGKARLIVPVTATRTDLLRYHDAAYVDYLLKPRDNTDGSSSASESSGSSAQSESRRHKRRRKTEQFGLEDDCPPFAALAQYSLLVAGATLTAVRALVANSADIAIHWDGGRHHAKRKQASGFCYVADIVIGIVALAKEGVPRMSIQEDVPGLMRKPRILYLDLDIHQGDGVAQAFHSPNRYPPAGSSTRCPRAPQVLTLSLHHSSPLFFPPPVPLSLLPAPDTPHPFTLSIPLRPYASSATYARLMQHAVDPIANAFEPDYVVVQLGLDGLALDPLAKMGNWALGGPGGVGWCLERIKGWKVPLCVLGGGGYNHTNAARGWAYATSVLLGQTIPLQTDIPEHEHVLEYSPSFRLDIEQGHAPDQNDDAYLDEVEGVYRLLAERIAGIAKR